MNPNQYQRAFQKDYELTQFTPISLLPPHKLLGAIQRHLNPIRLMWVVRPGFGSPAAEEVPELRQIYWAGHFLQADVERGVFFDFQEFGGGG
jgi:hypothetical protein